MKRIILTDPLADRGKIWREWKKQPDENHPWKIFTSYRLSVSLQECTTGLYARIQHSHRERQIYTADDPIWVRSPYAPGEVCFVGEAWCCDDLSTAQDIFNPHMGLFYKAGMEEWELAIMPNDWRPAITMPQWASRRKVRIVSVRPEKRCARWGWKVGWEGVKG